MIKTKTLRRRLDEVDHAASKNAGFQAIPDIVRSGREAHG
jgi:hypothetical protein